MILATEQMNQCSPLSTVDNPSGVSAVSPGPSVSSSHGRDGSRGLSGDVHRGGGGDTGVAGSVAKMA